VTNVVLPAPNVKLDARYFDHPKIKLVGQAVAMFNFNALCFCNRHLTDGQIRTEDLTEIVGPVRELEISHVRQPTLNGSSAPIADVIEEVIERLIDAGLWERSDHGWVIHDYADWQPTRQDLIDAFEVVQRYRETDEHGLQVRPQRQTELPANSGVLPPVSIPANSGFLIETDSSVPPKGVPSAEATPEGGSRSGSSSGYLTHQSVSVQSRLTPSAETDKDQDPESEPLKGDPEWFAQELRGANGRTVSAIRTLVRRYGLSEAALYEALEIVRDRKPKNEAGYFVRCLQDIGERSRVA
jgi:hypothetical protein